MNEISIVAQEIAASRQRGIPADEGKLWETLHLDAERAAAGEEMLRSFLDLLVLRHDGFASGLSLLLVTHRLRRPAMDETGAELIVSGTAPSAQRSGFAWCEKPVC